MEWWKIYRGEEGRVSPSVLCCAAAGGVRRAHLGVDEDGEQVGNAADVEPLPVVVATGPHVDKVRLVGVPRRVGDGDDHEEDDDEASRAHGHLGAGEVSACVCQWRYGCCA